MPRTKKSGPRSPRRAGAVLVALTVEEREQMRAKAAAEGRPLAQWIRWVCLREAQRSSTPARPPT